MESFRTHGRGKAERRRTGRGPYISRNPATNATHGARRLFLQRRATAALALASALALGACDRLGEIVILPEFEVLDSFESGTSAWSVQAADLGTPPAVWSVSGSQAAAADGQRSVEITLDNANGAGKVWMSRSVDLTPSQAYDVTFSFKLGTPDRGSAQPWTVIAGAYPAPPAGATELTYRDGTLPDSVGTGALTWVEKSYNLVMTASAAGKGAVVFGIWGSSAGKRTYYVDDVRVYFTRR